MQRTHRPIRRMSLSDRFKRLPEQQAQRNEESTRQAREASQLLGRLRQTREEAERLAIEEITRTKQMQREEVDQHPEIVELRRKLRVAERDHESALRRQEAQRKTARGELEQLLRQETEAASRFVAAQDAEAKLAQEAERVRDETEDARRQIRGLEERLVEAKRAAETQFVREYEAARKTLEDAERELGVVAERQRDQDAAIQQRDRLVSEAAAIHAQQERRQGELADAFARRDQAAADQQRARSLAQESKTRHDAQMEELQRLRTRVVEPGRMLQDAERLVTELQGVQGQLRRDKDAIQAKYDAKQKRVELMRNEISQLEHELFADYDAMCALDGKMLRVDGDLQHAQERGHEARQLVDMAVEQQRSQQAAIETIERELVALGKTRAEAEREADQAASRINDFSARIAGLENAGGADSRRLEMLQERINTINARHPATLRGQMDALKDAIERQRHVLGDIQRHWAEWRQVHQTPLQEELDRIRVRLAELEQKPSVKPSAFPSITLGRELEALRERIRAAQERQHALDTLPDPDDPDKIRTRLAEKEIEVKGRLMSRSSPASPRFSRQLEMEAEAIMRAEAAAALERKQQAIERETTELSQLRLHRNPRFALDEDAKAKLWNLNEESVENGVIAQRVLELCQSKNIKIKE